MNALEQLTQSALVAEAQSKVEEPVVPKYTLEEALPLVKDRYDLLSLEDAIALVVNAKNAWEKIRKCDTSFGILEEHWCGRLDQDMDFFDIGVEDFIETCQSIVRDYDSDDLEIPEWFVDDDDLRDYFNDYSNEMWRRIDWGESLDKDSVREYYLEDKDVDLSEYIDNFRF